MTDKTISQLNVATSLNSTDVIPIVNNGETKQVSLLTLFSQLPLLAILNTFNIVGGSEAISTGTISLTKTISYLSNGTAASVNVTLPTGTANLVKVLIGQGLTSPIVVNTSVGNAWSTLTLNTGNCYILYFGNGVWNI